VNALGKRIANLDGLDPLSEAGKELVVDSRLNKDTSTRAAGLAVVPTIKKTDRSISIRHGMTGDSQDTVSCPTNGLLEVGIVKDDVRALSTQFECDILEVALGGGLHNLPADEGRTGERDLLDPVVPADGLTDGVSVSDNEVEDARGEADFADHVSGHERGQRGQLGGLHDDCVSGGESGTDLPAEHQDWEGKIRRTTRSMKRKIGKGTYEGSSKG